MKVITKTPTEQFDETINWTTRGIGGDTIGTSSWSVSPADLTLYDETNTPSTTTVWLSGGTVGQYYAVTNTIVTSGGRTFQETFVCNVVAQNII